MVEEGYDLVIRVDPDQDASLVGRVFLRDRLVVVARPDLAGPADDHVVPAVIRGAADQAATWDFVSPTGKTRIVVDPVLRLSSVIMAQDAVRSGVGDRGTPG